MSHIDSLENRRLFAGYVSDVTFGEEGVVGAVSPAYLLALQGGNVLTAGPFQKVGLRVARNLSNGRPDPSFGVKGVTDVAEFGRFGAAALGPDGVYTSAAARLGTEVAFARLNADGGLNGGFGRRGITTVGVPIANAGRPFYLAMPTSLGVDAQGRAVFGVTVNEKNGRTPGQYDTYGYVGRLTATGKLDKSFGHRGYIHIGGAGISGLALDPSGCILVQARSNGDGLTLPPQRLTADGILDGKFNRKMRETYRSGVIGISVDRLAYLFMDVDPAGRVLLRGNTDYGFNDGRGGSTAPTVVRITTAGQFDAGFGEKGFLKLPRGGQIGFRFTYASDGSLIIQPYQSGESPPVLRYDVDGRFQSATAVTGGTYSGSSSNVAAIEADGDLLLRSNGGFVTRVTLAARPPVAIAQSGTLNLYGTDAADTFAVDETGGIVIVRNGGKTYSFDRDAVKQLQVRLGAGRDRLTVTTDLDTRLFRKDGGDTITTGDGDDTLGLSGEGDDYVDSDNSTLGDIIRLGNGDAAYYGFNGADDIAFGDGDVFINSGAGNDTLQGGTGRVEIAVQFASGGKRITLAGGGGRIELGNASDVVRVGPGAYAIDVGGGSNRVTGGGSDDTIVGTLADD